MIPIVLTPMDIMYAAILALMLTWLVLSLNKLFHMLFKPVAIDFSKGEAKQFLQKCYALFPMDVVPFHGQEFKRGMRIRMTTTHRKVIEGEIVGLNRDNIICLITRNFVVAQDMKNVEEIEILAK